MERPLLQAGGPIACCTCSPDGKQLALSTFSPEIKVYQAPASGNGRWQLLSVLQAHEQTVSGLDWSCVSDMLVSCAHDRTAYVWRPAGEEQWRKEMVMARVTRAALCVAWAPGVEKFAIGSADALVSVCYYDADNKWWASKHVRARHTSSVVALAWHPLNSAVLATASTDGKCRVLRVPITGVDSGPESELLLPAGSKNVGFGEVACELSPDGSWVNNLCWTPSGDALLMATHSGGVHSAPVPIVIASKDCSPSRNRREVGFQIPFNNVRVMQGVQLAPGMPVGCLLPLSDSVVLGAGWEGVVHVFVRPPYGPWQLDGSLDTEPIGDGGSAAPKARLRLSSTGSVRTAASASAGGTPSAAAGGHGMLLVGTGGDAGICALLPLTQRHRHKPAASAADGADGGQPEAPTTPRFQQMGEEPSSSCFLSAGWDGRVLKFDLALLAEAAAEES